MFVLGIELRRVIRKRCMNGKKGKERLKNVKAHTGA